MILAILNLYVTLMPPIKFRLNLTYCLKNLKMAAMAAILDTETDDYSHSESLYGSKASAHTTYGLGGDVV